MLGMYCSSGIKRPVAVLDKFSIHLYNIRKDPACTLIGQNPRFYQSLENSPKKILTLIVRTCVSIKQVGYSLSISI